MVDVDYGQVHIRLAELMKEQNVSISKLAYRAEMQRTQLKAYMRSDIQRCDLSVLSRLCFALQCDITDLLVYEPPEK